MKLDEYFKQRRKLLKELPEGCVVIVSEATADGGRAGVRTEVRRDLAAHMIAERRARLATQAESAEFRGEDKNRRNPRR